MISELRTILRNILYSPVDNKDKIRLILRTLCFIPYQVQLQRLFQSYQMEDILQFNPRQYYRFSLPYLCLHLSASKKLEYIRQHLDVLARFKSQARQQIYKSTLLLADLTHVDQPLLFKAAYFEQFEKEGEITFYLEDSQSGELVYTLTGTLTSDGFVSGGFQGCIAIEQMRSLTKRCHGMRPHNLLFFCVTEFCRSIGGQTLYGISNTHHIYKSHKKTEQRIHFDYDNFWCDFTDQPLENAWFSIACYYPRKAIADIKSKKRSMYRKRYEMLDNIAEIIVQSGKSILICIPAEDT